MQPVILYSQPGCQPCRLVAMRLDKNGTAYTKVDVTEDAAGAARVRELGYLSTPVVECGTTHFAGYIPEKIDALKSNSQTVKELKHYGDLQDRTVVEDKG